MSNDFYYICNRNFKHSCYEKNIVIYIGTCNNLHLAFMP